VVATSIISDECEKLHATKKEVVDTDALIERYRKEIEDLKNRLAEREKVQEAPALSRRLSAKEVRVIGGWPYLHTNTSTL
jgi:hypothetical protein